MKLRLDTLNWPEAFPYKPLVEVDIEARDTILVIRWHVEEASTKAEQTVLGGQVYPDSCVEFFVKPDPSDPRYYNFEFNAAGKLFLTCRTGRHDPEPAPMEVLESVEVFPSLGKEPFAEFKGDNRWDLEVHIPITALFHHDYPSWNGMKVKANLYKCGDGLSTRHYVTWMPVLTEKPDFHRPEFFAELDF